MASGASAGFFYFSTGGAGEAVIPVNRKISIGPSTRATSSPACLRANLSGVVVSVVPSESSNVIFMSPILAHIGTRMSSEYFSI